MTLRLHRGTAALVALAAAACGTTPPPVERPTPSVQIPSDARIAFPVARFSPEMIVDTQPYHTSGRVAGGAVGGAVHCVKLGPVLLLPPVAIACLPFAAAIGGLYAQQTGPQAASRAEVERAEANLETAKLGLGLQQRLAEETFRGALRRGMKRAELLLNLGPTSASASPRYPEGSDYVIEVALLQLKATAPGIQDMRYRFILRARGRLVRVADGTVIEESIQEHTTGMATVEGWTEQDGRIAGLQFLNASLRITRAFLDRWVPVAAKQ